MSLRLCFAIVFLVSGCTPAPETPSDAGSDATAIDAAPTRDAAQASDGEVDAGTDAAASVDGGIDAPRDVGTDAFAPDDAGPPDAGPPRTLLLLGSTGAGAAMSAPAASTFAAGAWSTPTALGGTDHTPLGGGIAVLADGRPLAITHAYSTIRIQAQIRSGGSWSSAVDVATSQSGNTSAPITTTAGALVASMPQGAGGTVSVDVFDASTTSWMRQGASGAGGADYFTRPAIANGASDRPLALGSDLTTYTYSQRVAGVWSGGAIPGVTPPAATGAAPGRSMAALARVGTDRFLVALAAAGGHLVVCDFEAGTWSAPTVLASNVATLGSRNLFSMTRLPDGRIALFYVTDADGLAGGLLDGTTWTSIQSVPISAPVRAAASPLGIAPGIDPGVVLELVYLASNSVPIHVRLMDAASWTWSTPLAVPGATGWLEVFVASNG